MASIRQWALRCDKYEQRKWEDKSGFTRIKTFGASRYQESEKI